MTRITLRNVTKSYPNGIQAVRNASFEIASGEFVVLLGPSGCGKSTTLRMIAGLEGVSSGDVLFDEEDMTSAEPRERDVGMVFQNYALYPHLTVFENIAFPLRLRREQGELIRARVQEVAAVAGLHELLERRPRELSGGQRQRVALARAIVRTPRVFLFDEPLSNLDAQLRTQMRGEITRLQRVVGSTAVYVTHDQTEAMTMGDRIVIMQDGIVQQIGTPTEIYDNPANLFVAGFLGTPPMNFVRGEIQFDDGLWFMENGSGTGGGALSLQLVKHIFRKTPPSVAQSLVVGIRPEHIALQPFETVSDQYGVQFSFQGIVRRREYLGYETLLYVETSIGEPLKIVRASSTQAQYGESQVLTLYVHPRSVYVFGMDGVRL
jgi:multiple sugar transport system ATP-binding protein